MNIKSGFVSLLCLGFLTLTQSAHADFRKALDAYIARDGETMLEEVEHAVESNNNDGLMLFLMATYLDSATSDYDRKTKQPTSTLRVILPLIKWEKMLGLLKQATNNSTLDSQYYLLTKSQFKEKYEDLSKIRQTYIDEGSQLAMLESKSIVDRAKAGDMQARLALGFRYLNYDNIFGCQQQSNDPICQKKDDAQGYYWLKQAIKTSESNNYIDFDLLPSVMCEFLLNTAKDDADLKQAYLWAIKGINERAQLTSDSMNCLRHMYDSTKLKSVAPEVYAKQFRGAEFGKLVYKPELKELPFLVTEINTESTTKELPVFSYHFGTAIDVFSDGRVLFGYENQPRDLLMKVSSEKVKSFLSDIKAIGFYEWTTAQTSSGNCPDFNQCRTIDMYITVRDKLKTKRMFFSLLREDSQLSDWKYTNRKHMADIKKVVDRHFPTQHLRCEIGNSKTHRDRCVEYDLNWMKFTKE